MSAHRTRRAQRSAATPDSSTTNSGPDQRPLGWPGDAEGLTPEAVDFETLAHVLANTCRRGGRLTRFYALAQHAVTVSDEIEALDGLGDEERRVLALHALLADARAAWLGDAGARGGPSLRGAERAKRLGGMVDRAVRAAAGLDGELPPEQAELLRFVARMADAAERRDLPGAETRAGVAFPPLKRRIRPLEPGRAARLWLERFQALKGPPTGAGANAAGAETATRNTDPNDTTDATEKTEKETSHVTHHQTTQGKQAPPPNRIEVHGQARDAA